MTERFTLLSELGRGGMGVVWKARDEETGQIVALKVMREIYAEDADYVARFERELELAKRIDSKYVVKVLGYGVRQGMPYLALEYVDGPSLHEALTRHGPYNWPEARILLAQLAQGLADAHAAGVIHRDVKPSNVLIGPDGVAKLTDFGIARGLDTTRMTATSTMIGTPAYLAPEGPKDARSDLYSLGIIGYELLTGAPPFVGSTYAEVLLAHLRDAPDLARLPEETRPVIAWLLAKDPALRPRNAWEVIPVVEGRLFLTTAGISGTLAIVTASTGPGTPDPAGLAPTRRPDTGPGIPAGPGDSPGMAQAPRGHENRRVTKNVGHVEEGQWALQAQVITGVAKRAWHTATALPRNRVLLAGGRDGHTALSSAELFTVAGTIANSKRDKARSMASPRSDHASLSLANGLAMICGGKGGNVGVLSSAELYDSRLNSFLETGSMTSCRQLHTATLLPGGLVLVTGGWDGERSLASAEAYDPTRFRFLHAGNMSSARESHTATLLQDGRVLLAGGDHNGLPSETGDICSRSVTWSRIGPMATARSGHTAALLPNGAVLVAGGHLTGRLSSAEIFDPPTGRFRSTASMRTAREGHTATLTLQGLVLIIGGHNDTDALTSVEAYDLATGGFFEVGRLTTARVGHTATLLSDGRILVAGGLGQNGLPLDSIELLTLERQQ